MVVSLVFFYYSMVIIIIHKEKKTKLKWAPQGRLTPIKVDWTCFYSYRPQQGRIYTLQMVSRVAKMMGFPPKLKKKKKEITLFLYSLSM